MSTEYKEILKEFGNNVENCIANAFSHYTAGDKYPNGMEISERLMTRFRGSLIASICGEIEETIGRKFSKITGQLSDQVTGKNSDYRNIDMPKKSSLKGRARAMWAIRVAFTHGNGALSQISDSYVREFLETGECGKHLRGVKIENGKIILMGDVTGPVIGTALQILDHFGV